MTNSLRLHKLMAERGLCSRREAEKWIGQGRVQVNDIVITELGTRVDPDQDKILVDGQTLPSKPKAVYFAFHKPKHVIVSTQDPEGRPTIYDFLQKVSQRILPVGRLDFDSEGLLLLTNDNPLIDQLTHPRSKLARTYEVNIKPNLNEEKINLLRQGVLLEDGMTLPTDVSIMRHGQASCWILMTLYEGRNRQIRRMVTSVGGQVIKLRRIAVGPVRLESLQAGDFRSLTPQEIDSLKSPPASP
jgi:23S rRNA pseudouridine2605 synthase